MMLRCVILSSLAKRLLVFRKKFVSGTEIPWRLIVATRNRLIHAYLGIDDDTVWSIIQDNIPEFWISYVQ